MAEMVLDGGATRDGLVQRLFAVFAMQVRDIEERIARTGGAEIVEDTKVLSGLARTLETLISLDRKVQGDAAVSTPDADALRSELAARLDSLKPPARRTRKRSAKGAGA